jgi:hypothetical protein
VKHPRKKRRREKGGGGGGSKRNTYPRVEKPTHQFIEPSTGCSSSFSFSFSSLVWGGKKVFRHLAKVL